MHLVPDPETRADREAWSRLILATVRWVLVMNEEIVLTDPLTLYILSETPPEIVIAVMDEAVEIIGRDDINDLLRVVPDDRSVQARFLPPRESGGCSGIVISPILMGPNGECGCDGCTNGASLLSDGDNYSTYIVNAPTEDSTWARITHEMGACPCPLCNSTD